jgi:putative transposase
MAHYHAERNHQGLGNRLIRVEQPSVPADCQVERRIRLGGMLSFYQYAAS